MYKRFERVSGIVRKVGIYFLISLFVFMVSTYIVILLAEINQTLGIIGSTLVFPIILICINLLYNHRHYAGKHIVISPSDIYHIVSILICALPLVVSLFTHKPNRQGFVYLGTALEESLIALLLRYALVYALYILAKFLILRKRAKKEKAEPKTE